MAVLAAGKRASQMEPTYAIKVTTETFYVEQQSEPASDRYVFAYTITIENVGTAAAQLIDRHWIITDGRGEVEEVKGDGVVGDQPVLDPGESYQYTSGAMLKTPVGTMTGSYGMVAEDGHAFKADIPTFSLAMPRTLH